MPQKSTQQSPEAGFKFIKTQKSKTNINKKTMEQIQRGGPKRGKDTGLFGVRGERKRLRMTTEGVMSMTSCK